MKNLSSKVVLITGASSGIGEAAAYEFAKQSATVVLAARRKSQLEIVGEKVKSLGGTPLVVTTDVTKPAELKHLVDETIKQFSRIDVLLNIAGGGNYKWYENFSQTELRLQYEVNVLGLAELTRLVIPVMKMQRSGTIINMVSYASRVAVPPMTVYASTKYAVEGLTDGLRRELAPWGIKVIRIHPGGVTGTEYNSKASRDGVNSQTVPIGKVSREQVAINLVKLVKHPQREFFLGRIYDLAELINKLFPGLVDLYFYFWVKKMRRAELSQSSKKQESNYLWMLKF